MADERTGRHRRHRRGRDGPRGVPLRQPRDRRRARQRARARRRDRRPARRRPASRGQQGLRQLHPVHQRVACSIVEEAVADRFAREMTRRGAHVLDDAERDKVRDMVFPGGRFDTGMVGLAAAEIASRAGIRVQPRTRILVAPFDLVVAEEPLAHEKLCPVLGMVRVPTVRRGSGPPPRCCASAAPGTPRSCTATTRASSWSTPRRSTSCVSPSTSERLDRQRRLRHRPGSLDDDRHRVRRPVEPGREPRAEAPRQLGADRLQRRRPRGVPDFAGLQPWVVPPPAPAVPASNDPLAADCVRSPGATTPRDQAETRVAAPRRRASSARSCAGSSSKSSTRS